MKLNTTWFKALNIKTVRLEENIGKYLCGHGVVKFNSRERISQMKKDLYVLYEIKNIKI